MTWPSWSCLVRLSLLAHFYRTIHKPVQSTDHYACGAGTLSRIEMGRVPYHLVREWSGHQHSWEKGEVPSITKAHERRDGFHITKGWPISSHTSLCWLKTSVLVSCLARLLCTEYKNFGSHFSLSHEEIFYDFLAITWISWVTNIRRQKKTVSGICKQIISMDLWLHYCAVDGWFFQPFVPCYSLSTSDPPKYRVRAVKSAICEALCY